MRDFLVSFTSLTILLGAVWGVILAVIFSSKFLVTIGMPVELVWFAFGMCVLLCKPGTALVSLSSRVWIFVDRVSSKIL